MLGHRLSLWIVTLLQSFLGDMYLFKNIFVKERDSFIQLDLRNRALDLHVLKRIRGVSTTKISSLLIELKKEKLLNSVVFF
jgi:hypothetical protein